VDIDPIHHQGYIIASANEKARDDFLAMINPLLKLVMKVKIKQK
jgi:hypothetical protein